MGRIKWSKTAGRNLQSIHEYISRDSRTYASRFVKSLVRATKKLEMMPLCGRIVTEFEEYGFREVIYHNYRIVYRIIEDGKRVEILAVVHGARDMTRINLEEWEL